MLNATPALVVEAIDRLQKPDECDLDEVVDRLTTPRVAPREPLRERHETRHETLARDLVPVLAVAAKEPLLVERAAVGHAPRRLDGFHRDGIPHGSLQCCCFRCAFPVAPR